MARTNELDNLLRNMGQGLNDLIYLRGLAELNFHIASCEIVRIELNEAIVPIGDECKFLGQFLGD